MSDEPSPEAFREALKEGQPEAPAPEPPKATEPSPEPPPPLPPRRAYLRQSFGFTHRDTFLQGTFYRRPDGNLTADGAFGDKAYDNLDELLRISCASQDEVNALLTKIQGLRNVAASHGF